MLRLKVGIRFGLFDRGESLIRGLVLGDEICERRDTGIGEMTSLLVGVDDEIGLVVVVVAIDAMGVMRVIGFMDLTDPIIPTDLILGSLLRYRVDIKKRFNLV